MTAVAAISKVSEIFFIRSVCYAVGAVTLADRSFSSSVAKLKLLCILTKYFTSPLFPILETVC